MTFEDGELLKVGITVATITYSVVFGIVAKKVWDIPRSVELKLKEFETTIQGRLNHLQEHTELTSRRVDVHDRISSKIVKKDFDSKGIVETGIYPIFRHE